jgi:hypothetical protein
MVTASVLLLAVYVYTIVDAALRDRARVRRLPKSAWLVVVVALPFVGSVLWFALGRARDVDDDARHPLAGAPGNPPAASAVPSPGATPGTEAQLDALQREIDEADRARRIRELEQELARRRASGGAAQP